MSASLAWRIIPKEPKNNYVISLKFILKKKYNLEHGRVTLSKEDIPYLEGLSDGGDMDVKTDAELLIAAINKHTEIELFLIY